MRCLGFFIRGFFWVQPAPRHRDWVCYQRGGDTSAWILIGLIPVGIFGLGFWAGWAMS